MEEIARQAVRRRGRPPKSEAADTRELLLDAALRLFARQGYAGTTVRQIAAEIGVRDSAIYGHFPGKRAIFDALLAEAGPAASVLDIDVDALTELGPRRAVTMLTERLFSVWATPRAQLSFAMISREGGSAELIGAIETTRELLAVPFRRWQETGRVRTDVVPSQLVWELFAPMQVPRVFYLRGEASDEDVAAARQMINDHVAFFLTTILTPKGTDDVL